MGDPDLHGSQCICQAFAFRVVQVQKYGFVFRKLNGFSRDLLNGNRVCHSGGVRQGNLVNAEIKLFL